MLAQRSVDALFVDTAHVQFHAQSRCAVLCTAIACSSNNRNSNMCCCVWQASCAKLVQVVLSSSGIGVIVRRLLSTACVCPRFGLVATPNSRGGRVRVDVRASYPSCCNSRYRVKGRMPPKDSHDRAVGVSGICRDLPITASESICAAVCFEHFLRALVIASVVVAMLVYLVMFSFLLRWLFPCALRLLKTWRHTHRS